MEGTKQINEDITNLNRDFPISETSSADSNFSINSLGNVVPSKLHISMSVSPTSNDLITENKPETVNKVQRIVSSKRSSTDKGLKPEQVRESSIKFCDIKPDSYREDTYYTKKARKKAKAASVAGKTQNEQTSEFGNEVRKKSILSTSRDRNEDPEEKRPCSSSMIGVASYSAFVAPFASSASKENFDDKHIKFNDKKQENMNNSREGTRRDDKDFVKRSKARVRLSEVDDLKRPDIDDGDYGSDDSLGLCIDNRGRVVPVTKNTKER